MDLRTLETWTRQALEGEATRRGIRDAHLRSRVELVRLIVQRASLRPLQRGRRRVSDGLSKLSQARWAFDTTVEAIAAMVATSSRPPAPRTEQAGAVAPTHVSRPHDPPAVEWTAATSIETPASSSSVESLAGAVSVATAFEAIDDLGLAGVSTTTAAISVSDDMEDSEKSHEDSLPPASEVPWLDWSAADDAQASVPDDSLQWQLTDPLHARIRYAVSEEGIRRARAILGGPGELSVRVVAALPSRQSIVTTEVLDQRPVPSRGTFTVGPLAPSTRCVVSLGMCNGQRFVSIAHASVSSLASD